MQKLRRVLATLILAVMLFSVVDVTAFAATVAQTKVTTCKNTAEGIKVKWKKVNGASGYRIFRKETKSGKWEKLADVSKTSYVDEDVKNNKTYFYRVRAYKKGNKKVWGMKSTVVSQKYVKAPEITSAVEEWGWITVSFDKVKGAKKYYVYRKTGKNGKYKLVDETNDTYYMDENVLTNKTYYYKVKAKVGNTLSGASVAIKKKATYWAGDCVKNGHYQYTKTVVKPTAFLYGYTEWRCKCGSHTYHTNIKEPLGENVPSGDEPAYAEAVKRNEASVNYLNKVLSNDKVDLLQVTVGTEAEIRALKKHANTITEGCDTDYEKTKALYDWVVNNVVYLKDASARASDVRRTLLADCEGMGNVLCEMLRLSGIPAATISGYRGDMKTVLTENNMIDLTEGIEHMWVRAYVNGKWLFADPAFKIFDPKDEFDIPEWYYTICTDGVTPYYTGISFTVQKLGAVYLDGKYYAIFEQPADKKSLLFPDSIGVDLQTAMMTNSVGFGKGKNYAQQGYEDSKGYHLQEIFTNRQIWYLDGVSEKSKKFMGIAYYNGQKSNLTEYKMNGKNYWENSLTFEYSGQYLATKNGCMALQVGDVLKLKSVFDIWDQDVIYTSDNPSVLSINQEGKVTALKEGFAAIKIMEKNKMWENNIFIYVDNSYKLTEKELASKESIALSRSKLHKLLGE